jgi:hypothetical protein
MSDKSKKVVDKVNAAFAEGSTEGSYRSARKSWNGRW